MNAQKNNPKADFGAIILAAGSSVRMGRSKQLLPIDGEPLLLRTVNTVRAAAPGPVIVVLGADFEAIAPVLSGKKVTVVRNEQWPEGMGSSIRAGLRALLKAKPDVSAALIALGDQPALGVEAIRALATVLSSPCTIAAAEYDGHLGAPVIFGRGHFHELEQLRGTEGAKSVFMNHRAAVAVVARPELAVDLDTPEDYAAWNQ